MDGQNDIIPKEEACFRALTLCGELESLPDALLLCETDGDRRGAPSIWAMTVMSQCSAGSELVHSKLGWGRNTVRM